MYPRAFHYHRASSLQEATTMLSQLGDEAKLLAGGQSLIPLMKLRFANPQHLVDLNFVPNTSYIHEESESVRLGALTRHAEIETSASLNARFPILHDCAAGIADVQIRNRGTIGGSLAEADPSGDWAVVLLTQEAEVRCMSPRGERNVPLSDFITDAYTTVLAHDELVREVVVKLPDRNSGGAYLAFKRSAPVYPTASAAVRLNVEGDTCEQASIVLGCVGLVPVKVVAAENALRGKRIDQQSVSEAIEAVRAGVDPQSDMRGSAEYKRAVAAGLVKRGIEIAMRRARGERVEVSHIYA
jgi:aerobic carbon-monoxide dehydrogenase medium subunit